MPVIISSHDIVLQACLLLLPILVKEMAEVVLGSNDMIMHSLEGGLLLVEGKIDETEGIIGIEEVYEVSE